MLWMLFKHFFISSSQKERERERIHNCYRAFSTFLQVFLDAFSHLNPPESGLRGGPGPGLWNHRMLTAEVCPAEQLQQTLVNHGG